MLQRLLVCAAITLCVLPAHAGYVTGGLFLGGDLSYIEQTRVYGYLCTFGALWAVSIFKVSPEDALASDPTA